MAVSELERRVKRFRRELDALDRGTAADLAARYVAVREALNREIRALTDRIAEARDAGIEPGPSWLFQERRYRDLLAAVQREMDTYSTAALSDVRSAARNGTGLAYEHTVGLLEPQGVGAGFVQPPGPAVQGLTGATQPGGPVFDILRELGTFTAQQMRDELVTGLVLGRNPNVVARNMSLRLGAPLARARTVARTEMLRAYRSAARDSYIASDVVTGWVWWAAVLNGPCAACMAMHGSVHQPEEVLDGHPNCRCTQVPVVRKAEAVALVQRAGGTGPDLFDAMPRSEQMRILGPSKLAAYRRGDISLADLVAVRRSSVWGATRSEASLREALGRKRAVA